MYEDTDVCVCDHTRFDHSFSTGGYDDEREFNGCDICSCFCFSFDHEKE